MTPVHWLAGGAIALNAVLFWKLPDLSRRDVFFSVTVSAELRRTDLAIATLWWYRVAVAAGTTLALAALSWQPPQWAALGLVAQGPAVIAGWMWARRRIAPNAIPLPVSRVAVAAPRHTRLPGGWLARLGPFVILGATTTILALNWDAIPSQFPHHWNASGHPDAWSTKSVRSVFGTLLFGAGAISVMLFSASSILTRTKQVAAIGPSSQAEARYKRGTATYSVASAYVAAVLFSYFALRPLAATNSLGLEVWLILGVVVLMSIGMTTWLIRMGAGGQRSVEAGSSPPVGDATPDRAWKGGIVYFNPSDPALFVEKRMGLGWTLNFGNLWSWVLLGAALLPALGLALVSRN
jgi:uncharacterized membrane protein